MIVATAVESLYLADRTHQYDHDSFIITVVHWERGSHQI